MEEVSLEQVCFIIVKAREFDVKVDPVIPDPASNPSDDGEAVVLSDYGEDEALSGYPVDSTEEELTAALQNLNAGEMTELLALLWLGRGDAVDWDEAMAQAQESRDDNAVRYLVGTPLLGDLLQEGLAELGLSCEEFWEGHL